MKLVFNGNSFPYAIVPETGKIDQPPEKCYHCDNPKKISEGCDLKKCEVKHED